MLGPIFAREFVTVPRRDGHHVARVAGLGLLLVLGVTSFQATVGFQATPTVGEAARFGRLLFQVIAFTELTLLLFFAALSAANAVAQEKDRRTFVLLLLTDMRDHELVLGKLLGSLLPIAILLAVTIPVLALLTLMGGISGEQVVQAAVVLAATGLGAGSLGGLIALWRDKTFQSLALSVLALVLYVSLVQGVGLLGAIFPAVEWGEVRGRLGPYAAMQAVVDPPARAEALPAPYGYALAMAGWSILLNGLGIWRLRVWNPGGEPIVQRESPEDMAEQERVEREKAHAAPGPVRNVWSNPILWREIRTQAYGRRPLLVKLAYAAALALIVAFAAEVLYGSGRRPQFAAAYGLVPAAVLSLLLVAAQAVTSITSERDGRSLDLLLATDLSPREFVFGKLGGVAWNTKEYLLPPVLLAGFYAGAGAFSAGGFAGNLPSLVCVSGALLVLLAFGMMLGLHVALRNASSRVAIANTLGTVFFLSIGTLIAIYMIVINRGSFANQWFTILAFSFVGVGGLWWVLSADRPSPALTLASVLCPVGMFYCVVNILVGRPGTDQSAEPVLPFLVLGGSFGFAVAAMLVPLLSEFDVATGRTTAEGE